MKKNKKPIYFIIHIPKCAGITIKKHIQKCYDNKELIFFDGKTKKQIEDRINSLCENEKENIKVILGHCVYYGIHKLFKREARYVTFIRKPTDLTISLYNYLKMGFESDGRVKFVKENLLSKGKFIEFKKFLNKKSLCYNPTFRFLLNNFFEYEFGVSKPFNLNKINNKNLNRIKKTLNKFFFVGIVENQEDFLYLYHELGINKFTRNKNLSKKYFQLKNDKNLEHKILSMVRFDQKIYDYSLKLNSELKKKNEKFKKVIKSMTNKKHSFCM